MMVVTFLIIYKAFRKNTDIDTVTNKEKVILAGNEYFRERFVLLYCARKLSFEGLNPRSL